MYVSAVGQAPILSINPKGLSQPHVTEQPFSMNSEMEKQLSKMLWAYGLTQVKFGRLVAKSPLEQSLFDQVKEKTPANVKRNDKLLNLARKKAFIFRLTKEQIEPYDAKTNPKGLGLKKWLENYEKEAKFSTAGIRGPQNILYPWDTNFPISTIGVLLATTAKARVAARKYNGQDLRKLVGREVRYNSQDYMDLIARVQAAHGIRTYKPYLDKTIPIGIASFLAFKLDLLGGEYLTSSHGISTKLATKDLNNQGSQYLPEESMEFVDEIKRMFQEVEQNGSIDLPIAAQNSTLIDDSVMKQTQNGVTLYEQYLRDGVATPYNLDQIGSLKNKVILDNIGGAGYRTTNALFRKLGIDSQFQWLRIAEQPFYHGVGKTKFDNNGQNVGMYDWSADTTILYATVPIITKGTFQELLRNKDFTAFLRKRLNGTVLVVSNPQKTNFLTLQILPAEKARALSKAQIPALPLDKDRVVALYPDSKPQNLIQDAQPFFPVIETMRYKRILKDKPIGTVLMITDPDNDRLVTLQVEKNNPKTLNKLKNIGVDYFPLDVDKVLAVYTPNQSFLMVMDAWRQQLVDAKQWKNYDRFMIKTTASAMAWDEWGAANGIKVINTPVGFKELANIMKKVEKQLIEKGGKEDIVIKDVYGKEINLGKNPRLVAAAEESGGIVIGPEKLIESMGGA